MAGSYKNGVQICKVTFLFQRNIEALSENWIHGYYDQFNKRLKNRNICRWIDKEDIHLCASPCQFSFADNSNLPLNNKHKTIHEIQAKLKEMKKDAHEQNGNS